MPIAPKTRNSLILRLRDRDDMESWREFVAIYEPVIYRLARKRGLQDADAHELIQRVLIAVARAIDRFQPDKSRGKFRTWLYRITHNEFCKEIAVVRRMAMTGNSSLQRRLSEFPDRESSPNSDTEFSLEYRRSVVRWAADRHPNLPPRSEFNSSFFVPIERPRNDLSPPSNLAAQPNFGQFNAPALQRRQAEPRETLETQPQQSGSR